MHQLLCNLLTRVILFSDTLSSLLHHKVVVLQCISSNVPLKVEVLNKADIFLLENLSDFKEEVANCLNFAEVLSSGVDIFVNDSFSLSHKILASTVAVARFCSAHVVGFHSEESLDQLRKAADANRKPYIAIVCLYHYFLVKLLPSLNKFFPIYVMCRSYHLNFPT